MLDTNIIQYLSNSLLIFMNLSSMYKVYLYVNVYDFYKTRYKLLGTIILHNIQVTKYRVTINIIFHHIFYYYYYYYICTCII